MLNAPTRRTKRFALGVALGALALVSLAACGSGGTQADPRVLNIGNGAEPLSLDPHKASGT